MVNIKTTDFESTGSFVKKLKTFVTFLILQLQYILQRVSLKIISVIGLDGYHKLILAFFKPFFKVSLAERLKPYLTGTREHLIN